MPDLIGQSLGRYHILEQLGEGGMATVYKAYDTRLEADVAVKVIRTEQLAPNVLDRAQKRFEREAKALAKLTHPNIVKVTDYGEHGGVPYLVMPYLTGGTLKQRLGQPMPCQKAVRLLIPIANALDYAHQHGVLHRDVKPSNILITDSGAPMLSDFGIAKILDLSDGQTLTGTGVGMGTPEYMSPEQGLGKDVDRRTDIYALGVVLYELVTGHKPYTADTPMAVVLKRATEPLPRPMQYIPDLPAEVEQVLLKALAKEPDNRYADMAAFEQALNSLGQAQPEQNTDIVETAPSGKEITVDELVSSVETEAEPISKPTKSKVAWWVWAGLSLLGLAVVIAGIVLGVGNRQTALPAPTNTTSESKTQTELMSETPTNTSTMLPTPLGGGQGKIAFVSVENDIATLYIYDLVSNQVINLGLQGDNINLYPSPGGQLAFTVTQENQVSLYLLEKDSISIKDLEIQSKSLSRPLWSPDDRSIAVSIGPNEIMIIDIIDKHEITVTPGESKLYVPRGFSPDGSYLLFYTWDYFSESNWIISRDGLDIIPVGVGNIDFASWSPIENTLIFCSSINDTYEIFSFNAETEQLNRFTENYAQDTSPRWSPDGKQIAFFSSRNGVYELFLMDANGENQHSVAPAKFDTYPELIWSPDGKWIAYSVGESRSEMYLVNIETGKLEQLTSNTSPEYYIAWSNDSRDLFWVGHHEGTKITISQYDVDEKRDAAVVFKSENSIRYDLSPDNSYLLIIDNPYSENDSVIYLVSLVVNTVTPIFNESTRITDMEWIP